MEENEEGKKATPFELTSMEGSYKGGSFRESKEDLRKRKGTLGFWPASKRDRKKGKESCIFQSQLGRPSRSSWKLTGWVWEAKSFSLSLA